MEYKRAEKQIVRKKYTGTLINGVKHFNWIYVCECVSLTNKEIDKMVDVLNVA